MKLIEEYLQRHNISVAYAEYVHNGFVFYMLEDVWRVLRIHWRQDPLWHPGYYQLKDFSFRHDGYNQRGALAAGRDWRVNWDEYEEHMRGWAHKANRVTSDRSEAIVAAWEGSLFGWDGYLARHATDESFFRTIDTDLSVADRVEAIIHFIQVLGYGDFHDYWRHEMNPMIDAHCDWIAKLKA